MSTDLRQDILNAVIESKILKKKKCKKLCKYKYKLKLKQRKNPYSKYSYNSGLIDEKGNSVWGIDCKWLLWEIRNGNKLPQNLF